jgi:hypothetical protein
MVYTGVCMVYHVWTCVYHVHTKPGPEPEPGLSQAWPVYQGSAQCFSKPAEAEPGQAEPKLGLLG